MARVWNSAEGGTDTTTVSASNSGAGSGAAFDSVSIGASAAYTFDNDHPAHGSLAYKFSTGASSVENWAMFNSLGTVTQVWGRFYFYFEAATTTGTRAMQAVKGTSGRGAVQLRSDRKIQTLRTGGASVEIGTYVYDLSTLWRCEFRLLFDSAVGEIEVHTYLGDSTSAWESLTAGTNQNMGGADADGFRFGVGAAAANVGPFWIDDLLVTTDGFPGPGPAKFSTPPNVPRRRRTGLGELTQL